jgi:hypothetical protein
MPKGLSDRDLLADDLRPQCASQKTSAEPSALVVIAAASSPASNATPTTEATRNDP